MVSTLILSSDLAKRGLTLNDVTRKLRGGELARLRRGTYVAEAPPDVIARHHLLIQATAPEILDSAVFSHVSAGVLHGLPVPRSELQKVTITRRSAGHGTSSGILRARQTAINDDEVGLVAGHPVTTLARTSADLARTQPFEWGVVAVDAALHAGLDKPAIANILARHPRLHGLRRALNVVDFADARSESPAESLSRVIFSQFGLPAPISQFEIFDADGVFVARSDFGWPDYGLVGEVDGQLKYDIGTNGGLSAAEVVMAEKRREERIRECGLELCRWTWADVMSGEAARRVRRALDRRFIASTRAA